MEQRLERTGLMHVWLKFAAAKKAEKGLFGVRFQVLRDIAFFHLFIVAFFFLRKKEGGFEYSVKCTSVCVA